MDNQEPSLDKQNLNNEEAIDQISDEPDSNNATEAQPATEPQSNTGLAKSQKPQKKHKGIIITFICILVAALLGGGAFAIFSLISSSPDNIAKSAISNLIGAKQIAVDGSFNVSSQYLGAIGIKSFSMNLDSKSNIDSGYASTATIKINFVDGSEMAMVDVSEVMLKDGVFYLRINGLSDLYYDTYYDFIASAIESSLQSNYKYKMIDDCFYNSNNSYMYCYDLYSDAGSSVSVSAIEDSTTKVMTKIGEIVDYVDGSWFKFSIEEILNHELVGASLDPITRQGIAAGYNCSIEKINNFSNYSDEFSALYEEHPFIDMEPGQNSFYNITLIPDALADYSNAVVGTQFFTDLAGCAGLSPENSSDLVPAISAEDISNALTYFPEVSAKFDGLFDYRLTELKMSKDNDYYTLSSDFNFSYPNNIDITAPSGATGIMDAVEKISEKISELSALFY